MSIFNWYGGSCLGKWLWWMASWDHWIYSFSCSEGAFLFVSWMDGYFSVLSGTWDFLVTVRTFCHVMVPQGIPVDMGDSLDGKMVDVAWP